MAAEGLAGTAPARMRRRVGVAVYRKHLAQSVGAFVLSCPLNCLPNVAFTNARCFSKPQCKCTDKDQGHLLEGGADVARREVCGAEAVKKCEDATSDRWSCGHWCRRG